MHYLPKSDVSPLVSRRRNLTREFISGFSRDSKSLGSLNVLGSSKQDLLSINRRTAVRQGKSNKE